MFSKYKGMNKFAVVALLAGSVIGCGTTPNNYLPVAATNEIKTTDVYVVVPQKEIVAEVEASGVAAAGGGGLLLALIDVAVENSRASSAEELIQPIKDSLIETDFNSLFINALKKEFDAVNWMKVDDVQLITDVTETTRQDNYDKADAETVTFINAGYSLSPDFSMLKANANISMLPKADALKKYSEKATSKKAKQYAWHNDNNIYRDNISILNNLVATATDKEENAKKISENSDNLKTQMVTIASELAKQVVFSMNTTEVAPK
ncbi:hypothetical protein [Thalassotalea atypica]|uniref:hypothetical protein n=1 Tax=Thalassotalea atypica TaxID=2054316 RepID=UPI002573C22E|nr:hypothetical protein [Thalassotalea atypica]